MQYLFRPICARTATLTLDRCRIGQYLDRVLDVIASSYGDGRGGDSRY